ncbi:TRAP transporter substrate-binding protein [Arthrospira platensis]|uniref:TRAP dicarboxylate transporter DctP subunit n=1 Tax=Limnospira platensis NIES-46 TaxID=1236695 RepID=A0A5M3TAX4_LIMPL|nr:TRAP transporter substrate-binding protein [Arthrospira platensis]AMW28436.1 ABC transporter substrate-binding protein [Arthrospira platensis YZ]KDR58027.1 ABC transporter substrate-binding protein [Arthrospira platensis str. Paraca]MBD2670256.1 TRAP transporter substrate-binding protein [Arthrospira platensis FACHB-439]MBD2710768.1 TRAP transporter substrate-binding protein [Arthrospira platensis FACHB-835]MDF2209635.1 TRAP transporter substrate-binding protein [Arthrospira platensis NCB00
MKRRNILGYAATGVATAAALAACSPQNTGPAVQSDSLPRVRWKMATSWPTSLDTLYGAAELIAELVSKLTDGRFTIQTFAAGEIVPGLQVLDAIQQGTVECGHTASYYYIGKNPALTFGTCVPFGLNTQQQMAWLYHGGGIEAMNKLYADFNTIAFPAGNSGAQMGGWFKREVNNIADLNGLKMRIPGLGGEVLSRLGVNVQVLPGGEIFLALERGAIDAAEFVGPYDDEKLGLNNAARLYYYPGWWEPGSSFDLQINLVAWNRLPTEYQEILKTAASAANIQTLAKYDVQNPQALKRLIDGGTQLKAFSPEILQASLAATTDLLEDMASINSSFRDIYEPWKEFRDNIRQWHAVGEFAFSNFVSTPILEGL